MVIFQMAGQKHSLVNTAIAWPLAPNGARTRPDRDDRHAWSTRRKHDAITGFESVNQIYRLLDHLTHDSYSGVVP
jgi:hypothetical protein